MDEILTPLCETIASRKGAPADSSYTAQLFAKGRKKIAQKVAEEGNEVAIAAVSEGKSEIISESADLLYHLLVLWADADICLEEVAAELAKRQGISGLDEKASRG